MPSLCILESKIKKEGSCIFIFILPLLFYLFYLFFFANLAGNQSLYQEWGLDEDGGGTEGGGVQKELNEKKEKKNYTRSHTFLMGLF